MIYEIIFTALQMLLQFDYKSTVEKDYTYEDCGRETRGGSCFD